MQQALDALTFDGFTPEDAHHRRLVVEAIEALRARLAEPEKEQEPVAQVQVAEDYYAHVVLLPNVDPINLDQQFLYTAPSQREWQGLTDAEVEEAFFEIGQFAKIDLKTFARAIEAKLKEKNAL